MSALCRDCLKPIEGACLTLPPRCPLCHSPRVIQHEELETLVIAHIDCDAFYASVEKRDRPELRDCPVVVGGGKRGVVSAACYIARLYGIHSAMPMFKALKACPDAVVIRPDMAKYQREGQRVRELMHAVTPLVEPLSIDEAFLDLSGTQALHGASPALTLAGLIKRIEDQVGITASVGLSGNKFLAKVASDLDKPRGFAVIGEAEAAEFLADHPVGIIWGVGKALQKSLALQGIYKVRDLWRYEENELILRHGAMGRRLYRFSRGRDNRRVEPDTVTKSVSAETTFNGDLVTLEAMRAQLWPLCEKVARRLKKAGLSGGVITLKLKTTGFRQLTRSRKLTAPTCLAEEIYRCAQSLLAAEVDGRSFRLIGVGASDIRDGDLADPPDLLDPEKEQRARVEAAIDAVREKLGRNAIGKGRGLTLRKKSKR